MLRSHHNFIGMWEKLKPSSIECPKAVQLCPSQFLEKQLLMFSSSFFLLDSDTDLKVGLGVDSSHSSCLVLEVHICLPLSGCCDTNTINWAAYKLQKFAFHGSGGPGVLQSALFLVHRWLSFHCVLTWQKGLGSSVRPLL